MLNPGNISKTSSLFGMRNFLPVTLSKQIITAVDTDIGCIKEFELIRRENFDIMHVSVSAAS